MQTIARPIAILLIGWTLFLSGCSPEAKKNKHLESADRYYTENDYDRAEVEYLNLLKLDPQNGRAIGRLGLIYTAQGRTARAIAYIMRGREMEPNDLDLRLKIAQLYLASGRPADARAEVDFILAQNPQDAEAPSLLVATMANPGDGEAIRQTLLNLPAGASSRAPVLTALALLDLRLGRVNDAEALLERAKSADASYAGLYSVWAAVHLARKNIDQADASFQQAAQFSPPRSPRHIQYAQFKIRTGNAAAGIKLLEEITAKTPDYVPAFVALAEVHLVQNKLAESDTFIGKALGRDPQNLEALILRGRLHNLRNEPDKALALFEKLATSYSRVPAIHQELGRAYASTGELTKAINSLNQVVALAPNSAEATILLARLHSRKGDHNAAVALLRKTVEQRPELPQARLALADTYRTQGNLEGALTIYQQLEQQSRENPQIPILIGLVLSQQGNGSEARAAFERGFALNPESPVALEQLINLDLREKRFQQAVARIESEITKHPKLEGFGQLLIAKVYLAQDDRINAESRLKRAIELAPDSSTAYFLLAGVYTRTNRQEEALAQLSEVIARDPKQVTALMLIAVIQDQRGNHTAAREGYEKVLEVNPRSMVALNNLAYLYSEKLNDLDKAHELAQRARQLAPSEPHNADTLGWILYKKRQYSWALSLLLEAAEKLPSEAEIQYHLGLTHYMMGTEQPARAALQQALQLDPEAVWGPDARKALSILDINPVSPNDSAKPLLEKALSERADDPIALMRLAALQEREGKPDLAISSLASALKSSPQNIQLLLNLARLHETLKNSAKALDYAKEARKQAPDDAEVAWSLGRLAYQNADYTWAAGLLQEAASKRTDSPDLLFDLALATYSVGRIPDARSTLQRSLELVEQKPALPPWTVEARRILELITLAETPAEAKDQLASVQRDLEQDPESVPALMALGAISETQLDPAGARQAYEKSLARYPNFTPAKHRLVVMGASAKVFDQKLHDWALQIRSLYPNDALVAKTLGVQSYLKGDYARAVSLLKESRLNDAELLYFMGQAQLQTKDLVGGRSSLEQALLLGLPTDLSTAAKQALDSVK